jgi:tripartite-type tricarboxylate transporter receptor subunit TctC
MDARAKRRYDGRTGRFAGAIVTASRHAFSLFVLCALAALPAGVAAQPVPKLVHLVVPFSPGASNDVIARALAAGLARRLDTTVIVENRPGAGGVIGADAVAKSPHDGSVLLLTSSSFLTAAATQPRVPYDAAAAFVPVAMIGQGPLVLAVSATTPYKSVADVLAAARAKPDQLTYGTAGVGSVGHLATALFDDAAKIRMTHVPYKGAANAVVDLASGQIDVMISSYSTLAPLVKAGKVRPLAVTSPQPHPAFAELPTVAAAVPGYALDIWVAVLAPAGTPAALVERLNHAINEISISPDLAAILEPDGTVPTAVAPSALAVRIKDELAQWKRVATEHGIVAE